MYRLLAKGSSHHQQDFDHIITFQIQRTMNGPGSSWNVGVGAWQTDSLQIE